MKIITVAEMQAVEQTSNDQGWTFDKMMEKAGEGLADIVHSFYAYEETQTVLGLIGSGNNGGDTLIALERLSKMGWNVSAFLVRPRLDNDLLVQRVITAGGQVRTATDDFGWLDDQMNNAIVVLDGVVGTGVKLPLKQEVARVLEHVKQYPGLQNVVAVDCPSGIDMESGEVAPETIEADLTVCMAAVKQGLLTFPAFNYCGSLEVVDIGLPEGLPPWENIRDEMIFEEMVRSLMPLRNPDSHKGTFGTVGIVAGSLNFSGAVILSASAAYRSGAGLVQIAAPAPLHAALAGQLLEATWVLLPHDSGVIAERAIDELMKHIEKIDIMLIGPGFGTEESTASFVRRLFEGKGLRRSSQAGFLSKSGDEHNQPRRLPTMVVDADGLKLISKLPDWHKLIPADSVLTPHPGEMSIMTGKSVQEIQASRVETARYYAQSWGHVVVLKGALTVVAAPDGRIRVVPVATSALAHGGTGDVLAGIIAGFRAQGASSFDAAVAAAWIHAQAGLLASEQIGHEASVLAGDLIDVLPEVLAWVW